jgi:hypothetical protein
MAEYSTARYVIAYQRCRACSHPFRSHIFPFFFVFLCLRRGRILCLCMPPARPDMGECSSYRGRAIHRSCRHGLSLNPADTWATVAHIVQLRSTVDHIVVRATSGRPLLQAVPAPPGLHVLFCVGKDICISTASSRFADTPPFTLGLLCSPAYAEMDQGTYMQQPGVTGGAPMMAPQPQMMSAVSMPMAQPQMMSAPAPEMMSAPAPVSMPMAQPQMMSAPAPLGMPMAPPMPMPMGMPMGAAPPFMGMPMGAAPYNPNMGYSDTGTTPKDTTPAKQDDCCTIS